MRIMSHPSADKLPVIDIVNVLDTFTEKITSLEHTNSEQRMEISRLNYRLGSKEKENLDLKRKVKSLQDELATYKKPTKNSHNSSLAPSRDPISIRTSLRTVSLREKSGLKRGGQPGHPGSTLEQTLTPDHIIKHSPDFCRQCGRALPDELSESLGKRQVVDLPEIKPLVSEHRIYGKQCSCGCYNKCEFPDEARAPICYGPNIRALTSYFQPFNVLLMKGCPKCLRIVLMYH
jgi:uncharacterized coiled-coil protein SlyX